MIVIKTEPISVNDLYKGRRFLTQEGKTTKDSMIWEIKKAWRNKRIINEDVGVRILFYLKDNRKDLDNLLKALLDIITGTAWVNDRLVQRIYCEKIVDKKNPRIEIDIYKLKDHGETS